MAILFVGIDLAKNVFAVHGVDEHGKAVLVRPTVQRAKLHELFVSLPVCTIGMEALKTKALSLQRKQSENPRSEIAVDPPTLSARCDLQGQRTHRFLVKLLAFNQ